MSKFISFCEAREYVRSLGFKSKREWKEYSKTLRPKNIPSNPWTTYGNEWISFMDWMGYDVSYYKYSFNKDFFEKWSHDMAYVLGFWFADGHMHVVKGNKRRKDRYIFGIAQSDKKILEDILDVMESDYKLYEDNHDNRKNTTYKIIIDSEKLVKDVIKLGGKSRKSLDMKFPCVPDKYLPDFIRGLWDGDGSVFIDSKNRFVASYTC